MIKIVRSSQMIVYVEAVKMFEELNEGGYTTIEVFEWNEEKTLIHAPTFVNE